MTTLCFVLILLSWPGVCVDVVSGESPLAKVAAQQRLKVPSSLPPPKTVNTSSRDIDVTTAATKAVSKGILMRFLSNAHQTLEELVSGGFTWKEALFLFLGVASIALSCAAMIQEASLLVDVLAWTCIIVGPSAAVLQRKVSLLEGMRELTNKLREEVNEMTASNSILQSQNSRLAKNTQK
jgi:hypothetical protein